MSLLVVVGFWVGLNVGFLLALWWRKVVDRKPFMWREGDEWILCRHEGDVAVVYSGPSSEGPWVETDRFDGDEFIDLTPHKPF